MIDTTVFQNKTAVYYTLGCKLNFSETSTIGKILREVGVRTARKGEKADICVVNTCSVTEMADKKCRQAIHRLVLKKVVGVFVLTLAIGVVFFFLFTYSFSHVIAKVNLVTGTQDSSTC